MKLEYWQTPEGGIYDHQKREWHCHFISGARITFSASGYDSKSGAITAMCNHAISLRATLAGITAESMSPEAKKEIRAKVRAQAKERV